MTLVEAVALFAGGLFMGFLITEFVHTWNLVKIERRRVKEVAEAIKRVEESSK